MRPTVDRIATDSWPTYHRQLTDIPPTYDRYSVEVRWRGIDRYSGDTLSLCRPNIDRLLTNSGPTLDGLSVDSRPTVDRLTIIYRSTIDRMSIDYRSTIDWYIDRLPTDIAVDIAVDITSTNTKTTSEESSNKLPQDLDIIGRYAFTDKFTGQPAKDGQTILGNKLLNFELRGTQKQIPFIHWVQPELVEGCFANNSLKWWSISLDRVICWSHFSISCELHPSRRTLPYTDAFRPSTGPTSKNRAVFTRHYCTGILFRQIEVTFDLN